MEAERVFGADAVADLRGHIDEPGKPMDVAPPPPPPLGPTARAKQKVKGVIRRAISWYVDDRADDAAAQVAHQLGSRIEAVREEARSHEDQTEDVHALNVNFELLKGELRSVQTIMEELATAIAPASGISDVSDRMAELRERVNALDRRLRRFRQTVGAEAPAAEAPLSEGGGAGPAPVPSETFDYVAFERRFRGDPERILEQARERYLELLREHAPVLDVGCGAGELLAILRDEGVEASGVDITADMVAEARARGLEVYQADAVEYLRSIPEHSLGSIVAIQVIEHLPIGVLVQLLELAASRLRPGGVFIAETPNPGSLFVLGNSYILDPTHVWPIHPALATFLCEGAGFQRIDVRYYEPAEDLHLPLITDPDAPAWVENINRAFEQLNTTVYGPLDYAVIATAPGVTDDS